MMAKIWIIGDDFSEVDGHVVNDDDIIEDKNNDVSDHEIEKKRMR